MMKRTVQEVVNLIIREWYKNGLIKRKTMFNFISTTMPMLEQIKVNSKNGKCVCSISDYLCYFIEVLNDKEAAVNVLAHLRASNKAVYNEVIDLLTIKDLVILTKSKPEILESKNLDKVKKSLRTKLDKQTKAISQETQNNV